MDKNKKDHTLAGKLLLAMPNIGDPRFNKAVILLCAHDEKGAMGLVINQTAPGVDFRNLLEQTGIISDIKLDESHMNVPVMAGGPVDQSRGFLLHSNDFVHDDTIRINQYLAVTGTMEALKKLVYGEGPEKALFILGYAGWSPGQLDQELQQNAWLVAEPDQTLVFHGEGEDKWRQAVNRLGFDPAMLSVDAGHA